MNAKISQYADDTTLILDGSAASLQKALELLDKIALISGLKVNYEKTEALWIGNLRHCTVPLLPQKKISWVRRKVKALEVWFSKDEMESLNRAVENWQFRRLTLLGKITVIKNRLASQLVYILAPLPTQQKTLEEINRSLFNFLWHGKGDKIKRSEMINDYDKGGLKMLDIKTTFKPGFHIVVSVVSVVSVLSKKFLR